MCWATAGEPQSAAEQSFSRSAFVIIALSVVLDGPKLEPQTVIKLPAQ
jgi:hypothetical protein